MYEAFYSLRGRPFGAFSGTSDCWLSPETEQSLQHAVASLQNGAEIVLISGPRGSGRTTLARELERRLSSQYRSVFLGHCEFAGALELWRTILFELGQDFASMGMDEAELVVLRAARELQSEHDGLLVIADDADSLSDTLLDDLRRLTVQRHDGRPVVQLVLSGTYDLEERLAAPELQQVAERVGRQIVLEALTREQSGEYLQHRIAAVEGSVTDVFSETALQSIATACDGNLQCLDQLADHALLLGFANEERPVSDATVAAALEDLKGLSLPWNIPTTTQPVVPHPGDESSPESETPVDGTRVQDSSGDDTCVAVAGPPPCQSWWDNETDAATIEVGAEQSLEPATVCTEGDTPMIPSEDPSSLDRPLSEDDAASAPEIHESQVVDPYAALDRAAESHGGSVTNPAHVPTGTTFVCESHIESFDDESDRRSTHDEDDRSRTTSGIETRLLLDVTDLRNELRAESESIRASKPSTAHVQEIALKDPDWDIVEPEAAAPPLDAHAVNEASDAAFRPTETMIDVVPSDADDEQAIAVDNPEQRRYARLFTRLKERRADAQSESDQLSLRLWR